MLQNHRFPFKKYSQYCTPCSFQSLNGYLDNPTLLLIWGEDFTSFSIQLFQKTHPVEVHSKESPTQRVTRHQAKREKGVSLKQP